MTLRKWTMIVLFAVLTIAIAGCAATVPQEDYDQVVSDLDHALDEVTILEDELASTQSQLADLEAEVADLETELIDAQTELADAQTELADAQAALVEAQTELADAQAELVEASTAEQELLALQEKVAKAAISAEIMDVFLQVGFGGGDLTEEDAMGVFLELTEKVEASGDEGLQEKFQAVLFSFGGEQEALDLVEYMLGTMSALGE
jgi:Skp family chaperone for outer membrane proteins